MASTARAVRDVLVNAIKSIAVSNLGFDESDGNVRDYLLEEELAENVSGYLTAVVQGTQKVRCWAVQVYERETLEGAFTQAAFREYDIYLECYYGGEGESPINDLIDSARAVRQQISILGGRLGETVQAIREFTRLEVNKFKLPDVPGEIYQGKMTLKAEKRNASW